MPSVRNRSLKPRLYPLRRAIATSYHTPAKRTDTPHDLVALIRRLAEHSPDPEIAMVFAKQCHRTATGLSFTAARVAGIRECASIPAGPHRTATSDDAAGSASNYTPRNKACCPQRTRMRAECQIVVAEAANPSKRTTPWMGVDVRGGECACSNSHRNERRSRANKRI